MAKPAAALAAGLFCMAQAWGQYPGHLNVKPKEPTLRSIAVVEWTGPETKPAASRIIPIAVYDGQDFQPGGLYLARPAPLALYSGTEYFLESAGRRQGIYDVDTAQEIQGYWYGYGNWKSLAPPPAEHPEKQKGGASESAVPGRPRLHYDNSAGSGNATPSGDSQQASPPPSTGQPSTSAKQPPAAVPGRPVLRHRPETTSGGANSGFLPSGPETDVGTVVGRPHLSYGGKNPTENDYELSKLKGAPQDLHQIVAVSDAVNREPQSFIYSWANPSDAAKMRAAMEKLAMADLSPSPSVSKSAARRKSAAEQRRERRRSTTRAIHEKQEETPAIALAGQRFEAYGLTYNSGATLVFTATTSGPPGKRRYITLIAQPDFYGVPQVIFKSIASDGSLDETPAMKLIDAVDSEGNHRGDLVFELRSRGNRAFAIYQVIDGHVQQLFNTGPLSVG